VVGVFLGVLRFPFFFVFVVVYTWVVLKVCPPGPILLLVLLGYINLTDVF